MAQSFTSLHYHIVFSTSNRTAQIKDTIQNRLFQYIGGMVKKLGGHGATVGGMSDHIHLLANLPPTICVSDAVRKIKACSSKWIHETFPAFEDLTWQPGYSAFSVSESNMEKVRQYIVNQETHHRKRTFDEELNELLSRHGLKLPQGIG